MSAYDAREWSDFAWRARALATVLRLLGVVIVSLLGLVPGQSRAAPACELLGTGVVFAALIPRPTRRSAAGRRGDRVHAIVLWLLVGLGTVRVVVGAVSLLAEAGGGLYWVAAAGRKRGVEFVRCTGRSSAVWPFRLRRDRDQGRRSDRAVPGSRCRPGNRPPTGRSTPCRGLRTSSRIADRRLGDETVLDTPRGA
jgi:hypothetical protein